MHINNYFNNTISLHDDTEEINLWKDYNLKYLKKYRHHDDQWKEIVPIILYIHNYDQ